MRKNLIQILKLKSKYNEISGALVLKYRNFHNLQWSQNRKTRTQLSLIRCGAWLWTMVILNNNFFRRDLSSSSSRRLDFALRNTFRAFRRGQTVKK